jgi:HK97 family phage portal protein
MGLLAEAVRSVWLGPYSSGDKALASLFGGKPSASGISVNEYTALNLSAVWAAVTVIAGTIASLPLILYKRLPNGGKERDVDHPTYELLHDAPNPEMTAMVFRETLQAHVLLWGNGYAEIQRDEAGRPKALWPITPDVIEPFREDGSGRLRYRVTQTNGAQVTLDPDRILHIPGLGFDGIRGYSVIYKARESLGLLSASERFGSTFFGNGAWPGLVAQHPGKLNEAAHTRLKTSLNEALQGPNRAHSVIVTEEGIKIEKTTIPPNDAQFLETRRFQILEVARWFNIPPHKLRDLERATFSNIEQQGIDWVIDLRLWLVRWEQEIRRKLISRLERKRQFAEHLVDGLLRGDTATRYGAYSVARNWGWMSTNEIRSLENLNPVEGGDMYLVPLNMVPADKVPSTAERVDAVGSLIRAGYDPAESLKVVGLPDIAHIGAPPVTVQPKDDYPGAAARGAGTPPPPGGPDDEAEPDEPPAPDEPTDDDRMRRLALVAAEETLKALPPPPAPDTRLADVLDEVARRLSEPAPAPAEPLEAVAAEPVGELLAASEARILERVDGNGTLAEMLVARMATELDLRAWQEATLAMIAGRLVRRELAQAKKLASDPTRATDRLATFYLRWVEDAMAELRPWLLRISSEAAVTGHVATMLGAWSAAAQQQCTTALGGAHGLDEVVRRWEVEREASMTAGLMEAINAH